MYYGYPDIYCGRTIGSDERPEIIYAIDLMNAVHTSVDFEQALTLHIHVEKCAQQAISGVIRNNSDDLRRLDRHCDFAPWVVAQKRGTQNNRDERLRDEIVYETEVASTSKGRRFELCKPPPRNWKSCLGDRTFKSQLTAAVGAQALIESVKQLLLTNCRAEIVLSGVPLQVTEAAQFVRDVLELDFSVIPADEEHRYPVVIIYNKFKDNIPNARRDFETNPAWAWSASI